MIQTLYISRSLIEPARQATELENIIETSRAWNAQHGITGALLSSGTHFAQVLEGDAAAVCDLMTSIRADPRHSDLSVLTQGPVPDRAFAGWSMAYVGQWNYVQVRLDRCLSDIEDPIPPAQLLTLLQSLVANGGVAN